MTAFIFYIRKSGPGWLLFTFIKDFNRSHICKTIKMLLKLWKFSVALSSWKSQSRQRSHRGVLLYVDYCQRRPAIITWLLYYRFTCPLPARSLFIVHQQMGVSYLWKHADFNSEVQEIDIETLRASL